MGSMRWKFRCVSGSMPTLPTSSKCEARSGSDEGERLEDQISDSGVILSYEGLDRVVRQTSIRSDLTPVRRSSTDLEFELTLRPKERILLHFEVSCEPEKLNFVGYTEAFSSASSELTAVAGEFAQITSSNSRFSDWIARSMSDLQMMMAGNPERNYPYAGVPWFSTVFGRDGIITALQTLWLNPEVAKGVLDYLAFSQADRSDPVADSEPGKILHEMRRSEMAATGEVPFARYYGSVDATPLFIMLAGAYFDRTGDRPFLERVVAAHRAGAPLDRSLRRRRWRRLRRSTPDKSSKGLVQQGWKDSNDSVFHADGKIAEPPIALCEVQGYVYAARNSRPPRLSRVFGRCEPLLQKA